MDEEIKTMQKLWGDGIVEIGKICVNGGDYVKAGLSLVKELYNYDGEGGCLFKPTKASVHAFRENAEDAASYFVGGSVKEDKGFALHPWKEVYFDEKYDTYIDDCVAIVMGYYNFVDYQGNKTQAEYTFGYKRRSTLNHLSIFTHHSSIPFK